MIIIELDKKDSSIAEQICDLAEEAVIVEEPRSFSSDLNMYIQVGITLIPSAISAVVLIVTEIIRNKKHIRLKIDGFEIEGVSEEKSLRLAEEYLKAKQDEKAKEELIKLFSVDARK